ncbi:MAG: serine/threonine protein kinase [Planctomycetaceae bacterium]|nr:serine/threonine protein kinase [Planctomycetaceae bacterium]
MTDKMISHFTVREMLGAGAMGEVFLAHDPKLDRAVAIKLLPRKLCEDENLRKRFLLEAQSASALNHQNVCTIYEVGETQSGQPYICMEYIDGQTLEDRLQQEGSLAVNDAIEITRQILEALTAAYEKKIVHRDLKPANISMTQRQAVKILDFGLAKRLEVGGSSDDATMDHNLTAIGSLLGTPNYMSPEQALGKNVDHLSDLFSVGVIFYQMLSGRLPFAGQSIGEVLNNIINRDPAPIADGDSEISRPLNELLLRALSKDKAKRFQSAEEMLSRLKAVRDPNAATPHECSSESAANSDVYISYSALDDQSLSGDDEGWITRFHRNLRIRLQQLAGRQVKVYRPPRKQQSEALQPALLQELPKVKSLLTVVSPPFANSPSCAQEVQAFVTARPNPDAQLVKVVKMPVDDSQLSGDGKDVLKQVNDHNFFEQDESGRIFEYEESFGEDLKRRYYEKIYDVAHEINQTLTTNPDETLANGASNPVAYVATSTSDVRSEYEVICRELTEQGYQVVPDKPLSLEKDLLIKEVQGYLEHAEIVIQLIGQNYGVVPENSDQSVLELQSSEIRTAVETRPVRQFVWRDGSEVTDKRQHRLVDELRTVDASGNSCELVEGQLSLLKEAIAQHLMALQVGDSDGGEGAGESTDVRMVYLVCDSVDEDETEALEDYLFSQGIEVSLPDFDCPQGEVSQLHLQTLCECDAVIIFYGGVRKSWVDIKLRDTLKAPGYGRSGPIPQVAVYIAPPFDKRKDRFKSHHAAVVQQPVEGFAVSKSLADFVEQIK